MAKHPHRLILLNKKTWRCTLEGCGFFVHLGLAHVLEGKTGICWGCGEQFIIDGAALRDEMPHCADCRAGHLTLEELGAIAEKKVALAKIGVKDESELTPQQRSMMKALGTLPDEVEVIEPTETEKDNDEQK